MTKKLLTVLVSVAVLAVMLSVPVFAAENSHEVSSPSERLGISNEPSSQAVPSTDTIPFTSAGTVSPIINYDPESVDNPPQTTSGGSGGGGCNSGFTLLLLAGISALKFRKH